MVHEIDPGASKIVAHAEANLRKMVDLQKNLKQDCKRLQILGEKLAQEAFFWNDEREEMLESILDSLFERKEEVNGTVILLLLNWAAPPKMLGGRECLDRKYQLRAAALFRPRIY